MEIAEKMLLKQVFDYELDKDFKNNLTTENIEKIWNLSGMHSLASVVSSAFVDNNLCTDVIKTFFSTEVYRFMCESERQDYELKKICDVLNNSNIFHIPLKGSVIKKLYPQSWMRTSCDIDILVHENELERTVNLLENELSYTYESKGLHDISMLTPSNVHVELHYLLIEENRLKSNILQDVWSYVTVVPDSKYTMLMTDEMFYFYHIAHMAKHFKSNGFGIRHLIDLWILNHKIEFERNKREHLLKKGNLLKFEQAVYHLCEVLFDDATSDDKTDMFIDYIFNSGTYGSLYNDIALKRMNDRKSKLVYYFNRIFMPCRELIILYPSLKSKQWLYPYYLLRRWLRILFYKNHKRLVAELQSNSALNGRKMKIFEEIYNSLDL